MRIRSRGFRSALDGAGISVVFCTLVSTPAHAQQAADAQEPQAEALISEVVVTGSRVRREGFEAPTPMTVLGSEILEKLGVTDVASALNQLPAFQADQNASTNTLSANAGRRYANLRNLGSQRTLVLVDGRRTTPSALTGQTDLNAIPQVLIERIDVVTGGASAQWGSDAVSGVVNMVTKKAVRGFEADVSYGVTQEGDGDTMRAGLAYGADFSDGRGHLVIGGEYVTSEGVDDMYTRDWGRQEWGFVNNTGFATNGLPKIFVLPNVRRNQLAAAGMIVSGPFAGTTFDTNGQPRPFVFGSPSGSGTHSGGDGYAEDDGQGTPLEVPLDRGAAQVRLSYDVTPGIEVFAEASFGYLYSAGVGPAPIDYSGGGLVIRSGNPYIPASLQQQMTDLNVSSFNLARYWKDDVSGDSVQLARPSTVSRNTTQSFTLGASGTFGDNWGWDAHSQIGSTEQQFTGRGYRLQRRFYESTDAVLDVNGDTVCRSTLTSPGNGCVPVNLFGRDSVSDEAWAYFTGDQRTLTTYDRSVLAYNLHGEPFSTWAGEVSVATGLEYRKDRARLTQLDARALARSFNYGNAQPINGSIDVTEGYLETVIPLLADVRFAQALEFDGAVRATDYSTSGTVNTWKAGLNWTVDSNVRFRGSVSRDIRAPNISELYTAISEGTLNAINPATGGNLTLTTISSGNVNLEPEEARTYTAGVVLTPDFIPNFKLSVDYYDIDIEGVITSISAQTVINYCYAGVASFCDLINNSSAATAIVSLPFLNLAGLEVKGWDVEAAYGFDLGSLPGRVDLNLFATYQPEILVDNGTSTIDRAGDMGRGSTPYGGPKWKWNALASYSVNQFSSTIAARYVGAGKKDVTYTAADISDNKVKSAVYVTLSLGYDLPSTGGMDLRLYADVHNLLNVDPPVNPHSSSGYPYNPIFHDPIGRRFTMGMTAKF